MKTFLVLALAFAFTNGFPRSQEVTKTITSLFKELRGLIDKLPVEDVLKEAANNEIDDLYKDIKNNTDEWFLQKVSSVKENPVHHNSGHQYPDHHDLSLSPGHQYTGHNPVPYYPGPIPSTYYPPVYYHPGPYVPKYPGHYYPGHKPGQLLPGHHALGHKPGPNKPGHHHPGHDSHNQFRHFEPGQYEPGHYENGPYVPIHYEPGHHDPGHSPTQNIKNIIS